MSQTKKHCEPLVAVWLRPSTTEPCICCKQVAEKPRGEHLKNDVCMYSLLLAGVLGSSSNNFQSEAIVYVSELFVSVLLVEYFVSNKDLRPAPQLVTETR